MLFFRIAAQLHWGRAALFGAMAWVLAGAVFAADGTNAVSTMPGTNAQAGFNRKSAAPRAARTVQLVYDASESDVYYNEMIVEKAADNSLFCACAWYNGLFGLQQFNGTDKRAIIFAVWDDKQNAEDPAERNGPARPVQTVFQDPRARVSDYEREGVGKQAIREFRWRLGETVKFAVHANRTNGMTTFTGWVFDPAEGRWTRVASFRLNPHTPWLRGFYSYVEDFYGNTASISVARLARIRNVYNHESEGMWIPVNKAMFTVGRRPFEAKDRFDAGLDAGGFYMATGGDAKKSRRIGENMVVEYTPPLSQGPPPELPFLKVTKPGLEASPSK